MKKFFGILFAVTLALTMLCSIAAFAKTEVVPDAQGNIPYEPHDFQKFSDGYLLSKPAGENSFRNHWTPKMSDPNASKMVDDGDGEMSLLLDACTGVFHDHRYKEGYTFFCDIMNGETDNKNFSGVILNWGEENNKTDTGFITNNGLRADGEDAMVGYSGCGFKLVDGSKDTLRFFIYTFDKEFGVIETDIKTRSDYSDAFICLQVVDTTNELVFFVDDDWICTISYANDDLLPDGDEYAAYNERYYRTAKLTDSEGNELLSTDKALISKTGAIALASYNEPMYVDNISITETDEDFELPTPRPKATATPEVTEAPETPAPATDAPATEAPKGEDVPGDAKKGCGSTLTVGFGAVLVIGAAFALRKKEL